VIIILTKVDIIGRNQFIDGLYEREFNVYNIYKNPFIYDQMKFVQKNLGVRMDQIIPISNYSSSDQDLCYYKELFHLHAISLAITYSKIQKIIFSGLFFLFSSSSSFFQLEIQLY